MDNDFDVQQYNKYRSTKVNPGTSSDKDIKFNYQDKFDIRFATLFTNFLLEIFSDPICYSTSSGKFNSISRLTFEDLDVLGTKA